MNKKHFTLVEVLVVVGIIGILAGLIFPAVGMARQAGRRTECVSNQGQLMKLLTVTMNANDNYLVSGEGFGTANAAKSSWSRYLYDKGLSPVKEPFQKLAHQGMILGENGIKMGKRFPEFVVNPSDVVRDYGADTMRLYEMFIGDFEQAAKEFWDKNEHKIKPWYNEYKKEEME